MSVLNVGIYEPIYLQFSYFLGVSLCIPFDSVVISSLKLAKMYRNPLPKTYFVIVHTNSLQDLLTPAFTSIITAWHGGC